MAEGGRKNIIYGRLDTIFCDADFGVRNAVERSDFTGDYAGWWKMEIGRGERNYFLATDQTGVFPAEHEDGRRNRFYRSRRSRRGSRRHKTTNAPAFAQSFGAASTDGHGFWAQPPLPGFRLRRTSTGRVGEPGNTELGADAAPMALEQELERRSSHQRDRFGTTIISAGLTRTPRRPSIVRTRI